MCDVETQTDGAPLPMTERAVSIGWRETASGRVMTESFYDRRVTELELRSRREREEREARRDPHEKKSSEAKAAFYQAIQNASGMRHVTVSPPPRSGGVLKVGVPCDATLMIEVESALTDLYALRGEIEPEELRKFVTWVATDRRSMASIRAKEELRSRIDNFDFDSFTPVGEVRQKFNKLVIEDEEF